MEKGKPMKDGQRGEEKRKTWKKLEIGKWEKWGNGKVKKRKG